MDLKIAYIDWWDSGEDFIFSQILRRKYNLQFTHPDQADIVFTGPFGGQKESVNSFKIYYTGENSRNPSSVDFKLNYNLDSDIRLPIYYVMSNEYTEISKVGSPLLLENRVKRDRTKFCGFLVSNPVNVIRNQAFMEVSKYKHVESGGRVFNNIGHLVTDTIDWMANYKFFICFENSKYDYYITEKLINAYHAGCIPIYWGSNTIDEEINPDCMINFDKINNFHTLVERIKEIDNNDDLYHKMLNEPLLKENKFDDKYNADGLLEIFTKIIDIKNGKK